MNNRLCEMFGIEVPIIAFAPCRDVVVEVFESQRAFVDLRAGTSARKVVRDMLVELPESRQRLDRLLR
jgi:hypothetical protein